MMDDEKIPWGLVEDELFALGYTKVNLKLGCRCGCPTCDNEVIDFITAVWQAVRKVQQNLAEGYAAKTCDTCVRDGSSYHCSHCRCGSKWIPSRKAKTGGK